MKKVINAGIGGRSFALDEDAYIKLKKYLEAFKKGGKAGEQGHEVMEDLEERIAEHRSAVKVFNFFMLFRFRIFRIK